jgi:CRP-like cAMP-binding protein
MEGVVKISVLKKNQTKEFLMKKGFIFGELALFLNAPRSSSVIANDFCICEYFTRKSLELFKKTFPKTKLKIGFN